MKWSFVPLVVLICGAMLVLKQPTASQTPENQPPDRPKFGFQPGPDGKKDFFKGGPPGGENRKIVKQFDKDGDGRLNTEERKAARENLKQGGDRKGGFGFGPPKGGKGFPGKEREPGKPGPTITPDQVKNYPDAKFYDPAVLRTLFLTFDNPDWEQEMADFYHTDVEIPATLTVDGKTYPNVGVHFRGASSFFGVSAGSKRSLNVSMDFVDEKQRLYGYKTLNLLNANDDPSLMHTVLYSHIARQHLPAPKANFVKVVINGEYWGVYPNVQQFNKEFLTENFGNSKGSRWQVPGKPGGTGGGLNYHGDDITAYKRHYEIKSKDDDAAWKALANLCKVLNTTPSDQLQKALEPILDIDGALKFLAVDVALINDDGYWTRASDYSIYLDGKGKFHILPHDMNESFGPAKMGMMGKGPPFGIPFPGFGPPPKDGPPKDGPPKDGPPKDGPGGFPGMGGRGGSMAADLDPLVGLNDANKPLRSKLLAVPALKAKYLEYVKAIARDSLDWKNLGPVVKQYRDLIEKDVEIDSRKLTSLASFQRATADTVEAKAPEVRPEGRPEARPEGPPRGMGGMSLRAFADQRRAYLLSYDEGKRSPERK